MSKTKFILFTFLIVILLTAFTIYFIFNDFSQDDFSLGVDFSVKQAEALELDWRLVYIEILDDLQPNKIRIHAPWDLIEPENGNWDFDDLDYQHRNSHQHYRENRK